MAARRSQRAPAVPAVPTSQGFLMSLLTRRRSSGSSFLFGAVLLAACPSEAPRTAPSPPVPPPPPLVSSSPTTPTPGAGGASAEPARSKLPPVPTDGLSLAERVEKRHAEESKLAARLANEERVRLLAYDKSKLGLHTQVFSFITKTRAALDGAKDRAAVEKLAAKQNKAIVATGKKRQLIDPKGGNSNVVTDYDVMLNALANDYPTALLAAFDGDPKPIAEQRDELDKRTKKITAWLSAVKSGK
jgi:hypothetical protein